MVRTSTRPRRNSPLNLDSATSLFKRSSRLVRRNPWVFGPLYGYQMLFLINSWITNPARVTGGAKWQFEFQIHNFGWLTPTLPPYSWGFLTTPGFLSFLMLAISFGVQLVTLAAQNEAADHKSSALDRLWRDSKSSWLEVLKLYVVLGAALLIPALLFIFSRHVFIGIIYLLVVGALLSRRYIFAPYIIIEEKVSYTAAMSRSLVLSGINPGAVWNMLGLSILIGLTGFIPITGGLLSFGLALLFAAAPAIRYEQLRRLSDQ